MTSSMDMCNYERISKCAICNTFSVLRCAKCKMTFYCSVDHQRLDWPKHKKECQIFTKQNSMVNFTDVCHGHGSHSQIQCQEVSHRQLDAQMDPIINYTQDGQQNFSADSCKINEILFPSEQRYDLLCKNIINDMNNYGLSVIDDFLGMEKGLQILNEVHKMYAAGLFEDGQLASHSSDNTIRTIRGDKITWVKGTEPGCTNIGYLINQVDAIVCLANKMNNNGVLGEYDIKERTKAMVACYPGLGSHYVMHVDNPNKDGRVITAIYYLNLNWDTKRSGGILRIFPESGGSVADIEPKFDRIIFFWSDRRNPHEVQPAHRTRYAITVWYFDANERLLALNRCKQYGRNANCL